MAHASARTVALACLSLVAVGLCLSAQQLPSEPQRQFGGSVTGAFEGWFDDGEGNRRFLVGYLNRNSTQAVDVPIGPNNRIEPGGPDLGQPTHFLPGRHWGMFTVVVPKNFTSAAERLTWTIVANGQTTSIPLRLNTDYNVSPFTDVAVGNTPPVIRFDEQGPGMQGPLAMLSNAPARSVARGARLEMSVWPSDDAKYASGTMAPLRNAPVPVSLVWSKYRGPGSVTFEPVPPSMSVLAGGGVNTPFRGKATSTMTFSEAGDYVLHLMAMDYSGEGGSGEVCCWTTSFVKVTVTP